MDHEPVRIPARSHRQAMDWSLVLLSQGIEPVVEKDPEEKGWNLCVNPDDYSRALEALRLYRIENRHWPWQKEVFQPGLIFDWASLGWALLVLLFFWIGEQRVDLRGAGSLDVIAASHGQWWRLFTAIWLHADVAHLAGNIGIGIVLLGLVMGRYGTAVGLLAAYVAGVGGNVVVWLLVPGPRQSLGASGMVMGALGLLAIQSGALWHRSPRERKLLITGFFGGVFLFLFLGTNPGTDVLAHAGGFVAGLALGLVLKRTPKLQSASWANLVSAVALLIMIILSWWLALAHG